MPETVSFEEAISDQPEKVSFEEALGEPAAPDLSKIKLSPYEQAIEANRGMRPESGMEPGTEFTSAVGESMIRDPLGTLFTPAVEIPRIEGKTTLGKIAAAPVNVAGGLIQGVESLGGLLTLPLGGPLVKGVFGGLAAKSAGEQLGQASVTGDVQQAAEGVLGAGVAPFIALHGSLPVRAPGAPVSFETGRVLPPPSQRGVPVSIGTEATPGMAERTQNAMLDVGRRAGQVIQPVTERAEVAQAEPPAPEKPAAVVQVEPQPTPPTEPKPTPELKPGRDWELFNEQLQEELDSFNPARTTGRINYELNDVADRFVDFAKSDKTGKPLNELVKDFAETDDATPSQIKKLAQSVKSLMAQEKPEPKPAPAAVEGVGETTPKRFNLRIEPDRTDGIIESDKGNLTVRAITSEEPDGTHSVSSMDVFVEPGILANSIGGTAVKQISLSQKIIGKTKEEARHKAYQSFTDEINKGNFDILRPKETPKQLPAPTPTVAPAGEKGKGGEPAIGGVESLNFETGKWEKETTQPRVGMRFLHKRILDPTTMGSNPKPQLFEVSSIRQGRVYYRPVIRYAGGREELGKTKDFVPIENWNKVFLGQESTEKAQPTASSNISIRPEVITPLVRYGTEFPSTPTISLKHGMTLGDVVDAPELFSQHPELSTWKVIPVRYSERYSGARPAEKALYIVTDTTGERQARYLFHEITHAIQSLEGRPSGKRFFEKGYKEDTGEVEARSSSKAADEAWKSATKGFGQPTPPPTAAAKVQTEVAKVEDTPKTDSVVMHTTQEGNEIRVRAVVPKAMMPGRLGEFAVGTTPRTKAGDYIIDSGWVLSKQQALDNLRYKMEAKHAEIGGATQDAYNREYQAHEAAAQPIREAINEHFRAERIKLNDTAISDLQASNTPAIWVDEEVITPSGKYEVQENGKLKLKQDLSQRGFDKNLDYISESLKNTPQNEGRWWGANKAARARIEEIAKERTEKERVEAEKKAKADAEEAAIRADNDAYRQEVESVELPKGKKTKVTVPMEDRTTGKKTTEEKEMTAYGSWAIRKNELSSSKSGYKYFITHVPTGLGVGSHLKIGSLSEAQRLIKGLLHTGVDASKKEFANDELGKLASATEAFEKGDRAPQWWIDQKPKQPQPTPAAPMAGPGSPPIVGMGGAIPAEFAPGQGRPSSNKNALVDRERAQRGLPPMEPVLRRDWGSVWEEAMARIDADPGWQDRLVAELVEKPRPITDVENAALLQRRVDLRNEYDKAARDAALAYADGQQEMLDAAQVRRAMFSDKLVELEQATGRGGAGTFLGRGLNARRMMMNEDFTLAKLELDKRADNGFRPLTDAERANLEKIAADWQKTSQDLEAKLARREIELSTAQAQLELNRQKLEAAQEPRYAPRVIQIAENFAQRMDKKAEQALAKIRELIDKPGMMSGPLNPELLDNLAIYGAAKLTRGAVDFAKWSDRMVRDIGEKIRPHLAAIWEKTQAIFNAEADALEQSSGTAGKAVRKKLSEMSRQEKIADITGKIGKMVKDGKGKDISPMVQKLARLFVTEGTTDLKTLVKQLYAAILPYASDLTERDVMDAFSGYGRFKLLSKGEIDVTLRDLRGQGQQIAKIEDMNNGKAPMRTGLQRRIPSDVERELIRVVNENKAKGNYTVTNPDTQLRSRLQQWKTTVEHRIADLEKKLAEKDYTLRKPVPELKMDPEAIRLQAHLERIRKSWYEARRADQLANRKAWQKVADRFVRWERAFKLSSPVVFGKLTSAALTRGVTTLAEEAVGGVQSLVPGISKVARQAPREGGLNISAIAKAAASAFNKGMNDAWQTGRRGAADIDLVYGEKIVDKDWANVFGQLHGMMKAPIKRAEFTLSLEKRMKHALANGVDITDPAVQMRLSVEALNDGYRSIFMHRGLASDAFNTMVGYLEKNKRFPVQGEIAARASRFLFPVVRVPLNIVSETMTGVHGLATASARTLFHAINGTLDTLPPEIADSIMRQFKKGSIGAGLVAIGYLNAGNIGGYDWRQKRKEGDVKVAQFRIGGVDIPRWMTHAPWFELMSFGATMKRTMDRHVAKGKDQPTAGDALWMAGLGLLEETPFIGQMADVEKLFTSPGRTQYLGEMAKGTLVPQAVAWSAAQLDKPTPFSPLTPPTQRNPTTIPQHVMTGIPGLRQQVPIKEEKPFKFKR